MSKKTIELIVCFNDGTWESVNEEISEAKWATKDRLYVEDSLREILEIRFIGRGMVAYMISWWGPEEED